MSLFSLAREAGSRLYLKANHVGRVAIFIGKYAVSQCFEAAPSVRLVEPYIVSQNVQLMLICYGWGFDYPPLVISVLQDVNWALRKQIDWFMECNDKICGTHGLELGQNCFFRCIVLLLGLIWRGGAFADWFLGASSSHINIEEYP